MRDQSLKPFSWLVERVSKVFGLYEACISPHAVSAKYDPKHHSEAFKRDGQEVVIANPAATK